MTTQDQLADRYGGSRPWLRATVVTLSVLVAAVFGGWLAWAAWFHGTPDARSELVAFDVAGPHRADATVDVRLRDTDVVATCRVRAYAADHAVVGELAFEVSGADRTEGRLERTIRTTREATSVENVGCTTPEQDVPR